MQKVTAKGLREKRAKNHAENGTKTHPHTFLSPLLRFAKQAVGVCEK